MQVVQAGGPGAERARATLKDLRALSPGLAQEASVAGSISAAFRDCEQLVEAMRKNGALKGPFASEVQAARRALKREMGETQIASVLLERSEALLARLEGSLD